ncbi:TonB-dependent receptor [Phenylobacterium sp. Root77]|uniref:TonB-dependent siderophore receptor n=1 Tax=Phenylobacterium sp. Root1290 TaxID=1736445 RepID=UPI0006FD19E7|nr:TonB-dependent siderophore receptor [Phenylobacterium sp. Root1290]KQW71752.1 TonB-dependent receptor [Phenylobacterium sp. Root1277]KQW94672.1 TonB-dependent receptor [Phenylobacterium sp. Root1290]KRC44365.1 TonB-dependent receptor [Phenylobacterium sp. Root77]
MKQFWFAGAAGAALIAAAGPAWSDEASTASDVEGVVVTGARIGEPLAIKSDTPLLEVPQAVSVITAERMQEQGVTRLADALRNVAGVSRSSTYGYYDSYQIRGYDAAYGSIFLDGLTTASVAGAVNEMAGLNQVEVIKGPASALFGASPLGGVINLVSKRPQADRFLEVGVATGSYGLLETTIDANSPLLGDGALLGRLNLVYRDSDDFVDYAHSQRIYIAPAVTWRIGEDTRLTLLGRYQRDYDSPWSPVSAWGTILPAAFGELPLSFSINNRGDEEVVNNTNAKQIGYVFEHRFSDSLRFEQTVRYEDRETYWDRWMFVAGFLDDNVVNGVQQGHILGRYLYGDFSQHDKDFGADSRLTWDFATGSIGHKVLAGIDYRRTREEHSGGLSNFNPADNPLDILNPDFDAPFVSDPTSPYSGSGKTSQLGFYLHDHVTLGNGVALTFGGRWDTAKSGDQEDSKFSPHAGLTWGFTPGASLYFAYSKSFTPTPSWQTAVDGSLLPPETGENIEGGVKVQTEDGTLAGMASIYQLTRQNVATEDPANPFFFVVTGEQRSRGVEVEGSWRPNVALEVTAAYAYTKAEVTQDNNLPVGLPLANFPEHALNLWGKYTVQGGLFDQLGISLGLLYNSDKHFYESVLYTLPSYTLLDFGLSYPFGEWKAQLNINNITDERYFPDACCLDRITPGEPRNWRLSVRRRF